MNSKERFEFYKQIPFHKKTEEETIQALINELIAGLYIPVLGFDGITKADPTRLEHFGIDDGEPINWGDLKCYEVKKFDDGSFLATIDEAAPSDCLTFCDYIERFVKSYGWEIRVQTEW